MEYRPLTEAALPEIAQKYLEYYNTQEAGCWTYEKACKRIRQILTMEDSLCLVQYSGFGPTGFSMGYYKEFDDLKVFCLEEILIFSGLHNRGYGSQLLDEIQTQARQNGAGQIELVCVADPAHLRFYTRAGFQPSPRLALMGKRF